jgi:hypothetical protein
MFSYDLLYLQVAICLPGEAAEATVIRSRQGKTGVRCLPSYCSTRWRSVSLCAGYHRRYMLQIVGAATTSFGCDHAEPAQVGKG